jgi:hypothetical protein
MMSVSDSCCYSVGNAGTIGKTRQLRKTTVKVVENNFSSSILNRPIHTNRTKVGLVAWLTVQTNLAYPPSLSAVSPMAEVVELVRANVPVLEPWVFFISMT